jgi:hypothetical protein
MHQNILWKASHLWRERRLNGPLFERPSALANLDIHVDAIMADVLLALRVDLQVQLEANGRAR